MTTRYFVDHFFEPLKLKFVCLFLFLFFYFFYFFQILVGCCCQVWTPNLHLSTYYVFVWNMKGTVFFLKEYLGNIISTRFYKVICLF